MRVIVIGGTGHIGSALVPRLVRAGCQVTSVSRGRRGPYQADVAWRRVRRVELDRTSAEQAGLFGDRIAALEADAIVDLTCYTPESAEQLATALRGKARHLLHCGTIWVHGPSVEVPTRETQPRRPFGDYGIRKAAIERYLLDEAHAGRLAVTVLHPGHLVGRGWAPVNPAGNFNTRVFDDLASGREVVLPDQGLTTLHHVHVADVAQAFARAIARGEAAMGESFHVVAATALTLRGYAEAMAAFFAREPRLRFAAFDEWRRGVSERDAAVTWDHLLHSPHCSIDKARSRLGYEPRYNPLDAVQESIIWLVQQGVVRQDPA